MYHQSAIPRKLTYYATILMLTTIFCFAQAVAQKGQIVYTDIEPATDRWEVFLIDADGRNPRNLTNHFAMDGNPTWSADGRQIAFVRRIDKNRERFEIDMGVYVMNADGDNVHRLTPSSVRASEPDWSPDGMKIVYTAKTPKGKSTIYVMDRDGAHAVKLTQGVAPRWSPDGRQIVFVRFEGPVDQLSRIYVMHSDGSNIHAIGEKGIEDNFPVWSPDGRQIAFTRGPWSQEIYVMNANGARIRNLTNHPADDSHPEWSPDGKWIAFSSMRDGKLNLFVMDTVGKNQRRLTDSEHWHWMGQWFDPAFTFAVQPFGKSITDWGSIKTQ